MSLFSFNPGAKEFRPTVVTPPCSLYEVIPPAVAGAAMGGHADSLLRALRLTKRGSLDECRLALHGCAVQLAHMRQGDNTPGVVVVQGELDGPDSTARLAQLRTAPTVAVKLPQGPVNDHGLVASLVEALRDGSVLALGCVAVRDGAVIFAVVNPATSADVCQRVRHVAVVAELACAYVPQDGFRLFVRPVMNATVLAIRGLGAPLCDDATIAAMCADAPTVAVQRMSVDLSLGSICTAFAAPPELAIPSALTLPFGPVETLGPVSSGPVRTLFLIEAAAPQLQTPHANDVDPRRGEPTHADVVFNALGVLLSALAAWGIEPVAAYEVHRDGYYPLVTGTVTRRPADTASGLWPDVMRSHTRLMPLRPMPVRIPEALEGLGEVPHHIMQLMAWGALQVLLGVAGDSGLNVPPRPPLVRLSASRFPECARRFADPGAYKARRYPVGPRCFIVVLPCGDFLVDESMQLFVVLPRSAWSLPVPVPPGTILEATYARSFRPGQAKIVVHDVLVWGHQAAVHDPYPAREGLLAATFEEEERFPFSTPWKVVIVRARSMDLAEAHAPLLVGPKTQEAASVDYDNRGLCIFPTGPRGGDYCVYAWVPTESVAVAFRLSSAPQLLGRATAGDLMRAPLAYGDEYADYYSDALPDGLKPDELLVALLRRERDGAHWWEPLHALRRPDMQEIAGSPFSALAATLRHGFASVGALTPDASALEEFVGPDLDALAELGAPVMGDDATPNPIVVQHAVTAPCQIDRAVRDPMLSEADVKFLLHVAKCRCTRCHEIDDTVNADAPETERLCRRCCCVVYQRGTCRACGKEEATGRIDESDPDRFFCDPCWGYRLARLAPSTPASKRHSWVPAVLHKVLPPQVAQLSHGATTTHAADTATAFDGAMAVARAYLSEEVAERGRHAVVAELCSGAASRASFWCGKAVEREPAHAASGAAAQPRYFGFDVSSMALEEGARIATQSAATSSTKRGTAQRACEFVCCDCLAPRFWRTYGASIIGGGLVDVIQCDKVAVLSAHWARYPQPQKVAAEFFADVRTALAPGGMLAFAVDDSCCVSSDQIEGLARAAGFEVELCSTALHAVSEAMGPNLSVEGQPLAQGRARSLMLRQLHLTAADANHLGAVRMYVLRRASRPYGDAPQAKNPGSTPPVAPVFAAPVAAPPTPPPSQSQSQSHAAPQPPQPPQLQAAAPAPSIPPRASGPGRGGGPAPWRARGRG